MSQMNQKMNLMKLSLNSIRNRGNISYIYFRLHEIEEKAKKSKYGRVFEISREDYVD